MKVITKAEAVAGSARGGGTRGIYALVDPETGVPRYVGSTSNAEKRLYGHRASSGRDNTPRARWLQDLKARGLWPVMWVLEEGDFGPPQSFARHAAEQRWIENCEALWGGADLNVRLTPLGHAHSKDSPGKQRFADTRKLREEVARLTEENSKLRLALLAHHVHHECTTVQKVQGATRKVAPHRTTTLWGWCSGATVRGLGEVYSQNSARTNGDVGECEKIRTEPDTQISAPGRCANFSKSRG